MSSHRAMLMALSVKAINWWDQPLTFIARKADSGICIAYYSGESTSLPKDDIYYRTGMSGPWTQLLFGQTLTAPAVGTIYQLKCTSNFFTYGSSNPYIRRLSCTGGWTINGNLYSLRNDDATSINALCFYPLLFTNVSAEVGASYTNLYIPAYGSAASGSFSTMQGSQLNFGSAMQSMHVRFTDWIGTSSWFRYVRSGGYFYKPSILPTIFGESNIPDVWDVIEEDVDPTLPEDCEMATCITQTDTQYIDTGIKARSGLTTEVKFAFHADTTDNDILGAYDGSNYLAAPSISGSTISYSYGASTGLGETVLVAGTVYTIRCINKTANRKMLQMSATASPTSLYSTTTSSELTITQNLFLGLRNNNGTPLTIAPAKASIYYCRIWDEYNTLLFDGVPVVDANGKGALYDRVSKTLKYSPDGVDFEVTQAYSDDRIQFWLDAKNNTGTGTVDFTATTWTDLIGGNNISGITTANYSWINGSLTHTTENNARLDTSGTIWATGRPQSNINGACTVEVCFYALDTATQTWVVSMRDVAAQAYAWQLARYNTSVWSFPISGQTNLDTTNIRYFIGDSNLGTSPVKPTTVAMTLRYKTDDVIPVVYKNGEALPIGAVVGDLGSMQWNRANSKLSMFGAGFGSFGYLGNVGVYAVRIYNRVLSDAELKYHAMLDRRRYLQYAATDTVFEVTMTEGDLTFGYFISGYATVDYGDGTTHTESSAVGSTRPCTTHTYTAPGVYTIVITPTNMTGFGFSMTSANASTYPYSGSRNITAVIQIGSAQKSIFNCFSACLKLAKFYSGVRIPDGVTNASGFLSRGNSGTIPPMEHLNDDFYIPDSVTNMSAMFGNFGPGLVEMPPLFRLPSNLTNAFYLFYGCPKLKTIPASLKMPKTVTNAERMLASCSVLEFDLSSFFPDEWADGGYTCNFTRFAWNSPKLTGTIPAYIYDGRNNFTHDVNSFGQCTLLTNFNQIPYDWGGGAVDIEDQTFTSASTDVSVTLTANAKGTKTFSSSDLPTGLSLNASTGAITGTVAYGAYAFHVTLTNSWDSKTVAISLLVSGSISYITGTGTQYIDTGILPTSDTKVEVGVSSPLFGTATNVAIFGSRVSATDTHNLGVLNYATSHTLRFDRGAFTASGSAPAVTADTYMVVAQDNTNNYINGTLVSTTATTYTPPEYTIYLFCINQQNTAMWFNVSAATVSIYYCKIWTSGVLVRDFVVALDPNNIPCMYDHVSKQYFYNAGSGTFNYG